MWARWNLWGSTEWVHLPMSARMDRLIFRLIFEWAWTAWRSCKKYWSKLEFNCRRLQFSKSFCTLWRLSDDLSDSFVRFTGVVCETDVNECNSNPCEHNGTCEDQLNGFICRCQPEWTGLNIVIVVSSIIVITRPAWTVNLPSYVRMSVARNSLCKNNETPNLTDLRATVLSTRIF